MQKTFTTSRRLLSVNEFMSAYGVGRTKTYALLAEGRLSALKSGSRTLIPVEAAEALVASLPAYRSDARAA